MGTIEGHVDVMPQSLIGRNILSEPGYLTVNLLHTQGALVNTVIFISGQRTAEDVLA